MTGEKISIKLNEMDNTVSAGITLGQLRDKVSPGADVLVVNGFPAEAKVVLKEGDSVVFVKRGKLPEVEELEVLMAARHTPGVHECMKRSCVGIAGLGGLGSANAIALARMGVGHLILVDFDVVEPSNLNRQHYYVDHIGMSKTEAMTEILNRINPYIKYFIGASGLAGYGDNNSIRTWRLGKKTYLVGDLKSAAQPGRGLMAPRVGIAAFHQANLAVALLMNPEKVYANIPDIISAVNPDTSLE
jgi:sulfur carrier protein ThiS adenylyltransferase